MSAAGDVLFMISSLVAVLAACGTIFARAPIRSALFLLVHIAALATLYLTLTAHLLAAMQMIVYAGAVVVLFVFVIMVIGPMREERTPVVRAPFARIVSTLGLSMIVLSIAAAVAGYAPEWVTIEGKCPGGTAAECASFGSVQGMGEPLFREAVVPFELVSVLLLVAILGAIAVARGRSAREAEILAHKRAEREALESAQREMEQRLTAEVSAHGGH